LNVKIKHSQTEMGLIFDLDYGSCFFCLFAIIIIISLPIVSAFFTYVSTVFGHCVFR